MTGLERDYLVQLTRIADALEKQNALQEAAVASLNTPTEDQEEDNQDISELIKKLSKFKYEWKNYTITYSGTITTKNCGMRFTETIN